MDAVKMEKLQAKGAWRMNQCSYLPILFVQYLLRAVLVGLLLSSPYWLAVICSSLRFFFFVCLPNLGAVFTGPRFIFIVSNIIIIFLVGESRLSKSSAQPEIYDEYVMRSQILQSAGGVEVKEKGAVLIEETLVDSTSTVEVKEEAIVEEPLFDDAEVKEKEAIVEEPFVEETEEEDDEEIIKEDAEKEEGGTGEEELGMEYCEDLVEEEDEGLPAEELNRRVEDFIAKFNLQRRLEAKMLICYQ